MARLNGNSDLSQWLDDTTAQLDQTDSTREGIQQFMDMLDSITSSASNGHTEIKSVSIKNSVRGIYVSVTKTRLVYLEK